MIASNDNASVKNISGMTPLEVVMQEALVNSIAEGIERLEESGELYEWELELP